MEIGDGNVIHKLKLVIVASLFLKVYFPAKEGQILKTLSSETLSGGESIFVDFKLQTDRPVMQNFKFT